MRKVNQFAVYFEQVAVGVKRTGTMKIIHSRTEDTASTNQWAMTHMTDAVDDMIYVYSAAYQTAGRGQGDHVWESGRGENILASFLVKNPPLSVREQFSLSHIIALTALNYIQKELPYAQISIKWPNDIYVNGQKIAGILIENAMIANTLRASVMGIGINVNQKDFPLGIGKATSMALLDRKNRIIETEIDKLSFLFVHFYQRLIHSESSILHQEYNASLMNKDKIQRFLIDGKPIDCRILGTDPDGKIQLLMPDGSQQGFYHHEIEWMK